jgi:hypothetical protein
MTFHFKSSRKVPKSAADFPKPRSIHTHKEQVPEELPPPLQLHCTASIKTNESAIQRLPPEAAK